MPVRGVIKIGASWMTKGAQYLLLENGDSTDNFRYALMAMWVMPGKKSHPDMRNVERRI